jgi:hypothetical protein
MPGPFQFGVTNNAGAEHTALISTNAAETLEVRNDAPAPGVTAGGGIRVVGGPFAVWAIGGQQGDTGIGVRGVANGTGVRGEGTATGVFGTSTGDGNGVAGLSPQLNGVQGVSRSQAASGVYGENKSEGGFGVAGRSNAPWVGPFFPPAGAAVLGDNTARGLAGLFNGTVIVNGALSKSGGGFVVDHPDPEQAASKVLFHSFVESDKRINIYNGNITTDSEGNATVELPGYFEALNQDFCYQLTVLGEFAHAIVTEEVSGNRFSIRTDEPNVRVSWQVTGVRQDPWANAHPMEVEVDKPKESRGKYLSPIEHGQPATLGLYYVGPPESEAEGNDTGGQHGGSKALWR